MTRSTRMQAGIDAGWAAAQGLPLEEALRNIRARMHLLFGDVPLALIDATVSMAYARHEADCAGSGSSRFSTWR